MTETQPNQVSSEIIPTNKYYAIACLIPVYETSSSPPPHFRNQKTQNPKPKIQNKHKFVFVFVFVFVFSHGKKEERKKEKRMSFQDLEAGRRTEQSLGIKFNDPFQSQSQSQSLASGIFQINTAVASFFRLVNSLGTPKDTLQLRERLHKTRLHIGQLVKDTSAQLKQASENDQHREVGVAKKISDAKLAKDFQSVLKEFQKAQRLAAERETTYAPYVPKEFLPSSYSAHEQEVSSSRNYEQQALLLETKRQEVLLFDNELVFNEAIIEEREQGIQEIQQQIGEVNEIFKDLAVLVHDQGAMIDDIGSNIENSHAATAEATSQLVMAHKSQRANSSLTCLLLVIFGIILLIVIIVVVA